jgi:chorismate mutase
LPVRDLRYLAIQIYSGIILSRLAWHPSGRRRCPGVGGAVGLSGSAVRAYTRPAAATPRPVSVWIARLSHNPDLAALRAEIDRIDDRIADLLVERLVVVRAIGRAKGDLAAHRLALRLGREAQMLRRLLARAAGGFPPGGILRIWREIIANSTQIEVPFGCVVDRRGGVALHDLARDQVGSATPIREAADTAGVLAVLAGDPQQLGVLAPPSMADWWPAALPAGVQVVARLPVTDVVPIPLGYVVARLEREPSGADLTLVDTLAGSLPREARVVARGPDGRRLVELEGFDAKLRGARIIGGYPMPLALPEGPVAGEGR